MVSINHTQFTGNTDTPFILPGTVTSGIQIDDPATEGDDWASVYDPVKREFVLFPPDSLVIQISEPDHEMVSMNLLDQRFYDALVVPSRSVPIFKQRGSKGPFTIRSYSSVDGFASPKSVGPHHFIGKDSGKLLSSLRIPEWINSEQVEIFSDIVGYCKGKNLRHNPVALAVIKKRDHKMIHAMYEHNPYFGLTLDIQLAIPTLVQLILNDSQLKQLPDKYYPKHARTFVENMIPKLEFYLDEV